MEGKRAEALRLPGVSKRSDAAERFAAISAAYQITHVAGGRRLGLGGAPWWI